MAGPYTARYETVLYVLALYALSDIFVSASAYSSLYDPYRLLGAPEHFLTIVGSLALGILVLANAGIPRYSPDIVVIVSGLICTSTLGMSIAELSRKDHSHTHALVQSLGKTVATSALGTIVAVFRAVAERAPGSRPPPMSAGTVGVWASIALCLVFVDSLITASFEHHIGPSHYVLGLGSVGAIILVVELSVLVALSSVYAAMPDTFDPLKTSIFQSALALLFLVFSIYQAAYSERDSAPMYAAIRSSLTAFLFLSVFSQSAPTVSYADSVVIKKKLGRHAR